MHFPKHKDPELRSLRTQPRELLGDAQSLGSRPGALGPATACHLLPPAPQRNDNSSLPPLPRPSHTLQL